MGAENLITPADLDPFGVPDDPKTEAMIEDALAQAIIVAPCLEADDLDPKIAGAAKAILRGAIVRWSEAGSGAKVTHQMTASVFSESETVDTTQKRKGAFWPSEIVDLQKLCKRSSAKPYTITMTGLPTVTHRPWCDLAFGAPACSCGADIAGHPIFEA